MWEPMARGAISAIVMAALMAILENGSVRSSVSPQVSGGSLRKITSWSTRPRDTLTESQEERLLQVRLACPDITRACEVARASAGTSTPPPPASPSPGVPESSKDT